MSEDTKQNSSLDALAAAAPAEEKLEQVFLERVRNLLAQLRVLDKKRELFDGGRYYHALAGNLEGYKKWLGETRGLLYERARIMQDINEVHAKEVGGPYFKDPIPDDHALSEMFLEEGIEERDMQTDTRLLREFATRTGKFLDSHIDSPKSLIPGLHAYARHIEEKAAHEYPGDSEARREARLRILDDELGLSRVARGIGQAALESEDYVIAGEAFGFAASLSPLPPADEQALVFKMKSLQITNPRGWARFASSYNQYKKVR